MDTKNFASYEEGPFYHGTDVSPEEILQNGLIMSEADGVTGYGVYVTIDLAIAEKYGKYVYEVAQFDCDCARDSCFDELVLILKEHVDAKYITLYETQ